MTPPTARREPRRETPLPPDETPRTAEETQQAPETTAERRQEETQSQAGPMGKVVHLHTAHPRVPIPYVTPGDMFRTARGATSRMPAFRKLAGYGVLGGMAVAGALEWPVAIAIGAATEVITREQAARKRAEQAEERRGQPGTGPSVRTEAAQPGQTAMA